MSSVVFFDNVNETATITSTFLVNNVPTDPTAVSCAVTDPSGASVVHTFGGAPPNDIVKVSTGVYKLDVACSPAVTGVEGLWSGVFIGTGTASDVQPATWRVWALDQNRWYVGPEELKDRLGISNTNNDSIVNAVCNATSRWIDRYCVVPETPVLTDDLQWVPAGELAIGDGLIGVDEYPVGARYPKRHYRRAVVAAVPRRRAECVTIILEDGREVTSATDHRWLARNVRSATYGWLPAREVQPGDRIASPVRTWPQETGFEAGWMSGILDGEGSLHIPRPATSLRRGTGAHVDVAQNRGPVLDRILAYLKAADLPATLNSANRDCERVEIFPRWASMELLGRLQPCRLMARNAEVWESGLITRQGESSVRVLAVEPAGVREVVSLGTSTGTYIANGLVSHNCGRHFFRVTDTRTFQPLDIMTLTVDDLVSVTSFKVDMDGDGVYETTWTQGQNYRLRVGENQYNILYPGEPVPYTQAQVVGSGATYFPYVYPFAYLDRVQISGVFGWPQVPSSINQAALLIAADWFKMKDAPWGVAGIGDLGIIKVSANPWVLDQLQHYIRGRGKVGV